MSYTAPAGAVGSTRSSALFRTYSARPKMLFIPSRSRFDSSTTLLDHLPEPSGSFAPQISALAHSPPFPNGRVVSAEAPNRCSDSSACSPSGLLREAYHPERLQLGPGFREIRALYESRWRP